jgi:tripartite-type tricarboxylate transporter receptor subunit TctC
MMATRLPGRRAVLAALAAACQGWPLGAARAAGFPQRPVRIVVPYSVGIGPDVVARGVAEQLARLWGQAVVVDNKPGASGIVAFGELRRTPPDGHTLFLADTATLAVNPLLHATLPYDPARDLVPLTLLFRATFLLWVGGASRLRDLAALGTAEVRSRAEQAGFELTPSTPQALRERIAADIALYGPLVAEGRVARL